MPAMAADISATAHFSPSMASMQNITAHANATLKSTINIIAKTLLSIAFSRDAPAQEDP